MFDVESYLHHHGESLVTRFDANSYLYLTRAMDLYDLGRDGGDERWLDRLAAPLLLTGIRTDWLFPPSEIRTLAAKAAGLRKEVTYQEIDSPHGHDAFLKEWDQLAALLSPFVGRLTSFSGSSR
jgi:homoserine O-acetyltransferase